MRVKTGQSEARSLFADSLRSLWVGERTGAGTAPDTMAGRAGLSGGATFE
jgi:hypothetical protein